MGLDDQTMMLVQENNNGGKQLILMFDVYTLNKISEFYVNIWDPILAESSDYKESEDLYSPNFAQNNRTVASFPRISCWNNGSYVLVGVGAKPLSRIYPEFRVYDADQNKIIGNFNRNLNPSTGSLLSGVFNNPRDSDTVLFLVKEEYVYTIVEADVLHNDATEIWTIASYDFSFVKIAEDLSWIYIGSRKEWTDNYG